MKSVLLFSFVHRDWDNNGLHKVISQVGNYLSVSRLHESLPLNSQLLATLRADGRKFISLSSDLGLTLNLRSRVLNSMNYILSFLSTFKFGSQKWQKCPPFSCCCNFQNSALHFFFLSFLFFISLHHLNSSFELSTLNLKKHIIT